MRLGVTIVLAALSVTLIVCALVARRSKKAIGPKVSYLLACLVPPIVGNLIIIASSDWLVSRIGSYLYFIGLDYTVVGLLRFTTSYCNMKWAGTKWRTAALAIVGIDIVQLLLNPVFHHAFTTVEIMVDGYAYFSLVPLLGQTFHRIVAYGVFFLSLGFFVYKSVTVPRIYLERYLVILAVMVFTGAWETYYIFSGSPIDQSMIGFGVFGVLVFYFALYYKPMRLLDRMLANVVSSIDEAVFFFDRDGRCIYANDAARRLFSLKEKDTLDSCLPRLTHIVGKETFSLQHDWTCERSVYASTLEPLAGALPAPKDMAASTDKRYWTIIFQMLADERGRPVGSFLNIRDHTEAELKLRRERYNAIHDPLTGLYNSAHLYEEARKLFEKNPQVTYNVIGIDVREFKLVNDIFSKEFGDRVLCTLANEIQRYASPNALYGRISGDKFGLITPSDEFDAEAVENYLGTSSLKLEGVNHPIVVHMGIYEVNEPSLPLSVMFDRAFMAVNSIKNDFHHHIARYDNTMRDTAIWNQKISAELDDAIAAGQIQPYLQPLVDSHGKVEGAEVLVRWIHPEEGIMSPGRFIPFFEENGRIAQLDKYMWEQSCQILADWKERGIDLFLSVNISPKDFYFIDVYETISSLVKKYDVDPAKLRLEITETVMMTDIENRLRIIADLRSAGFLVEMDDFGSGYSSLNMLKDIPVDVLKIDMMFLYNTKDQQRAHTILQTIINLSQDLGMPSITEGVETYEQLSMLLDMGCRMFQGYYFAHPMPHAEFEETYCAAA